MSEKFDELFKDEDFDFIADGLSISQEELECIEKLLKASYDKPAFIMLQNLRKKLSAVEEEDRKTMLPLSLFCDEAILRVDNTEWTPDFNEQSYFLWTSHTGEGCEPSWRNIDVINDEKDLLSTCRMVAEQLEELHYDNEDELFRQKIKERLGPVPNDINPYDFCLKKFNELITGVIAKEKPFQLGEVISRINNDFAFFVGLTSSDSIEYGLTDLYMESYDETVILLLDNLCEWFYDEFNYDLGSLPSSILLTDFMIKEYNSCWC